ncbi:nuclear respiratory factor 1 isoform X5 [Pristis pectinata]|uniref:nuclear respiratory factor 1 isoform X5 n=1 Tax=Pristis pectinata TaxID=685728 RepID=UPI00223E607F|nr:nuclear respiratory factor 1 isoform X5 [Pristis pectinata]
MEGHEASQNHEHMTTIEAHAVAQQVQQVHVATYTDHTVLSGEDDSPSSPEETSFDDSDILNSTITDEVTAHLAAAGPVGMAAAAAVATGKKRKRPHAFESNPSIRKRQQTRLLRSPNGVVSKYTAQSLAVHREDPCFKSTSVTEKLRATLDEYTTRVGQQAIVLCISPSKPNPVFKVFGAAPLENVVRKYKSMILEDLESALAEHAPTPQEVNSDLPPLTIDGIPVSVDKMTQAQLRAFIPEMLKYSTGRGKPGWGKESCRPVWWPDDIPWANVRSDVRSEEQKQRVSWTQALRTIVKNCYKQHGREDLLYAFEDQQTQPQTHIAHLVPSQTVVQTISNPDGTVSLIQVEQNWATLQGGEMAIQTTQASEATQAVASLAEAAVAASQEMQQGATVTMALNSEAAAHAVATLAEATLQGGGQIVLSGETAAAVGALTGVQDANVALYVPVKVAASSQLTAVCRSSTGSKQQKAPECNKPDREISVGMLTCDSCQGHSGLVQIPVSMYQTVVTSLAQGNRPVQVAMAPVTTRMTEIQSSGVTVEGQAVEVVTLEQ